MTLPNCWVIFLASSLLGHMALAQPSMSAREAKARLLTVSPETAASELQVRVAPGYVTALNFDMPLAPDGVKLEAPAGRLKRLDITERRITLEPATELAPSEQLRMNVSFAGEPAPTQVVITLVPATATVDTRVRVSRKPATMGELLVELEQARTQLEEVGQEPQGLSAPCPPLNLTEVVFSGVLGEGDFSAHTVLSPPETQLGAKGVQVTRYQTPERLLLAFRFLNTDSAAELWTPDQVELVHLGTGIRLHALSVEMRPASFVPGGAAIVLVHLEAASFRPGEPFLLAFSNKAGTQVIRWAAVKL